MRKCSWLYGPVRLLGASPPGLPPRALPWAPPGPLSGPLNPTRRAVDPLPLRAPIFDFHMSTLSPTAENKSPPPWHKLCTGFFKPVIRADMTGTRGTVLYPMKLNEIEQI